MVETKCEVGLTECMKLKIEVGEGCLAYIESQTGMFGVVSIRNISKKKLNGCNCSYAAALSTN